jgi:hypothetical protein
MEAPRRQLHALVRRQPHLNAQAQLCLHPSSAGYLLVDIPLPVGQEVLQREDKLRMQGREIGAFAGVIAERGTAMDTRPLLNVDGLPRSLAPAGITLAALAQVR